MRLKTTETRWENAKEGKEGQTQLFVKEGHRSSQLHCMGGEYAS
jgi:hypothetical protein